MSQLVGVLFALAVVAGFAIALVLAVRRQKPCIAEKTRDMVLISTAEFDRRSRARSQDTLPGSVSEATALFELLAGT